ncbi:cytochrome P450 4d1-like [Toxorhynchites rutilus septentrionalis]|uniref:cytochrome P450 4d1-like n=1 Tax=Toxorhynchites rutilus septentrionalis TaxID=329112 RepID=UPI002478A18A|nr:cytochrome P450 4d1-like [Toxorhynchites rutilus septentrionalis]
MILVFIVAIVAIGLGVFLFQKFSNVLYYGAKIGGPKGYPLIGNALLFINKTPPAFFRAIEDTVKQAGKCFRLWLGPELLIVITDAKVAEAILSSPKYIEKSGEYDFIRPWLGEGLLTSSNRKWHSHRKIITPTFHFKILEQFVEIFDHQSSIFIEQLGPRAASGRSFDVFPLVTLCALDVICESAMGTKVYAQTNSDSDYVKAVKEITYIIHVRTYDVMARYNIPFKVSPYKKRQDEALRILHGHTNNVIQSRRRELVNGSFVQDKENDVGIRRKIAFLDMLLQTTVDGRPLTDVEIREEVDTFMFEGHDTTTSAISFLLYRLAKHQDVQRKVYDEIIAIIGDDLQQSVTLSMLNELHYLDLVVKETLRLYPSVPFFGRKMLENNEIEGKMFPAGASLVIMPFFMGRDPEYFEDPLEFRPERFSVETSAEKNNPYRYIPFSAGPRNCIGQKFAMAEIKSLVSKVLRHFQVLPPEQEQEESFVGEMILRPTFGIQLRLKRRN